MKKRFKKESAGVIVWDFDQVLFHTKKFREDIRRCIAVLGMSDFRTAELWEQTRKSGNHFSVAGFVRQVKKEKLRLSADKIRKIFDSHIASNKYYSPETDKLLHRLKEKGFVQMILSAGHSRFQRKKMFQGCGVSFKRHFEKIMVTTRPKYLMLQKLRKQYPENFFMFVDDTKENLDLAQINVPGIITVHYGNHSGKKSVRNLEHKILNHAGLSRAK